MKVSLRGKWWLILVIFTFFIYIFITARPIPEETIISPRWISSLETNQPVYLGDFSPGLAGSLMPFVLGDYFGYFGDDGRLFSSSLSDGYAAVSENYWAVYDAVPDSIQVMNPDNRRLFTIDDPQGYPYFSGSQIYIIGNEQNSVSAIGSRGEVLWTFDFPSIITCIDAAEGYFLAGTADGIVILLDEDGRQVFTPFEPGGSRLSIIQGVAISSDASRMAVISGIDQQRFLLLERTGDNFRVIYHEFLELGFRRPVHISFIDNDTKVVFERERGIGIYDIVLRTSSFVPLRGNVIAFDDSGTDRLLFIITHNDRTGGQGKRLTAVRYPGSIIMDIAFRSENVFLKRTAGRLYLGGDHSIASFEITGR